MADFYYPTFRLEIRVFGFFFNLFTSRSNMGNIVSIQHVLLCLFTDIARIQAKMLFLTVFDTRTLDDDAIQGRRQQLDVMRVGAADNDGERNPFLIRQQAALAAFFFPDPSGFCPQIPTPKVLSPSPHRGSAIPRQCLPFHRIPADLFAITVQINRRPPSRENTGEPSCCSRIHF